jgi:hypothetical protein
MTLEATDHNFTVVLRAYGVAISHWLLPTFGLQPESRTVMSF